MTNNSKTHVREPNSNQRPSYKIRTGRKRRQKHLPVHAIGAVHLRKELAAHQAGRVLLSMPCDGQEAADVANAYALKTNTDFIVPHARSLGAMLVKGMTTQEVMLNMFGKADDPNSGGRQIPIHWDTGNWE